MLLEIVDAGDWGAESARKGAEAANKEAETARKGAKCTIDLGRLLQGSRRESDVRVTKCCFNSVSLL